MLQGRWSQLSDLFEREGRSLYALLTRLTLCEDIAEELMQELFIKLCNFKDLGKVGDLAAYARKTAINLAFERRNQKLPLVGLDEVSEPTANHNSPLTEIIQTEELEEILDAIAQLRGASREAFVMRYVQHKSYNYIAKQMEKTPHQVRALCFKALAHLQYLLNDDELRSSGRRGMRCH